MLAIGLAIGMGVAVIGYGVKFVIETREALALRERPRQPWDVQY